MRDGPPEERSTASRSRKHREFIIEYGFTGAGAIRTRIAARLCVFSFPHLAHLSARCESPALSLERAE